MEPMSVDSTVDQPADTRPGAVTTTTTGLGWPDGDDAAPAQHLGWPSDDGDAGSRDTGASDAGTRANRTSPAETEGSEGGDVSRETSRSVRSHDLPGTPERAARADTTSTTAPPPTAGAAPIGVVGTVREVAPSPATTTPPPSSKSRGSDLGSGHDPLTSPVSRETPAMTPLARAVADEARRRKALASARTERPVDTRIFTVANQKGGVGKTTTTVNLAAALAQLGMRVLVVDMDPQGNASTALGVPHHAGVAGIYDVLIEGTPLREVLQQSTSVEQLWCAPATIDLAGAEIELVPLVARESRLGKALEGFLRQHQGDDRFDFVFIDCPPSLGLLTVNAFVAASELLIPIQCEYYALEGVSQLLTNIEMIREHLNPDLQVSTIPMTMYDARTRLSSQVADEVREHFPEQVVKTVIPRSVRISEAPSHGETVMTYDPTSVGALSYREVAVEMTSPRSSSRTATAPREGVTTP